jgi:hypothetical protein
MIAQSSSGAKLADWLVPFRSAFTAPSFANACVLITGALLTPTRRTVTAALHLSEAANRRHFTNYHRLLNRARWSGREIGRRLLLLLIAAFASTGPVVVGIDDTIERRWGARITARGIYRDPVRSSHGHFVKASGLRWLSAMLLAPVPWAARVWALPFLTVLCPSERYARARRQRHKLLTDWARQVALQTARWLPDRQVVMVADSSFAAIDLLNSLRSRLCVITRLRLDARLFDPPPPRTPHTVGRPAILGRRQQVLAARLEDPATPWQEVTATNWYGKPQQRLEITSGTAIWHHPGRYVPVRYVLVRDPTGECRPQAFLCTDTAADPIDILGWFARRWSIEVTFAEVRRHLGVETQRQWSDRAIARTTPTLLALFSLVTLWSSSMPRAALTSRAAPWYLKPAPTFADALAAVRRQLWHETSAISRADPDPVKIPRPVLDRLMEIACYPA